ncbi:MAG: pilus assembly protein PilM [Verrucomicrobia bacterium]|nr:pilus assembly protein PilM [Verrucomicrobiota bacterium]MBU4291240.1 pilus assembly protein PilM [Verrucomicrobiota bacterium]MBU4428822.1 pilus assembly protein PilM [Verrucomicrobiota bacterium]MCG2680966.1 pilus assembly protein PilM [Kiritimatiellia bacterium]
MMRIKKGPQDIVGVDFDPSGVKCVRVRKNNGAVSVVSAGILPAVTIGSDSESPFHLPKPLVGRYVSICIPGETAVVKLLNLPGQLEGDVQPQIKEHMGIEEGDYRIGYQIVSHGHGRTETKLLTVAIPDAEAKAACGIFPTGWPAPISLEISGLASMTAFLHGPALTHKDQSVGVIEQGARVTFAAFFNKGELVLIRKFDFGHFDLLDRIQKNLGVDHETAENIVADGSFDVSQIIKEVSEPFIKQLVISKHFIERRENCLIAKLYLPSGKGVSRDWQNEIKSALSLDVDFWNPFEGLSLGPEAIPRQYESQLSRFTGAVGTALGSFEEAAGR